MQVTGMSGFGPVLSDTTEQEKLCTDDLGIAFEEVYDDYRFTEHLKGARHFSLMPLSRLPTSLFDGSAWPADVTVRQAWVEFQVDDIDAATQELQDRGYTLLVRAAPAAPRAGLPREPPPASSPGRPADGLRQGTTRRASRGHCWPDRPHRRASHTLRARAWAACTGMADMGAVYDPYT
jgi:hypothetical protein